MKGTGRIGLTLVLKVALVLAAVTWAGAAPFAYITNAFDNTVSVIDTATNAVVGAPISVGSGPYGVAVSSDGSRVYVGNFYGNTVSVISTATNPPSVVATVMVGSSPIGVAVTPDGSRVYVANSGGNTVSVISTATNTVGALISVGSSPVGVAVTPDGSRVYVANSFSNTVSVISTATNTVGAPISVGSAPSGVAVTPDGSRVYVANSGNTVSVISTATNTVVATVTVGSGPSGVSVTPDGSRVYVANYSSNTVSVISTATNMVVGAPIQAGSNPYGVAVTPDGSSVYVANSANTNTVSVISTATNTVVATVHVGSNPIAFGKFIGGKPDPVLTVPEYFQAGIPVFKNGIPVYQPNSGYPGNFWGGVTLPNYQYDFTNPQTTIQQEGCALTALTMVLNFLTGNLTTPTQGNPNTGVPPAAPTQFTSLPPANWKDAKNPMMPNGWKGLFTLPNPTTGSSGGAIKWNTFAPFTYTKLLVRVYPKAPNNGFPVFYKDPEQKFPDPNQTLDNILRNRVPVILPILNNSGTFIHFVVITGKNSQKNTYFVNDPGSAFDPNGNPVQTLLDLPNTHWYQNDTPNLDLSLLSITHWIVFARVDTPLKPMDPNTPQALGVYSNGPVEFILMDPQGRRTGFDPATNTSFQDIPASDYSTTIYKDEQNFSFVSGPFKALDMANQIAGQYTLDVIGTGSGGFTVEVTTSDAAGNWITQTYSGTTAPGVSSQFTFQGAVTIFAAFSANVAIKNSKNQFAVGGQFTLGAGSPGIDPLTQPVTLQVETFSITIPASSFQLDSHGNYVFQGTINGVQLAAGIQPQGGNLYTYGLAGQNANNLPTANPVDIRLAIGSNGGDVSVNATFAP